MMEKPRDTTIERLENQDSYTYLHNVDGVRALVGFDGMLYIG
jgi:DNA-binding LytR/AlgR family response regulator